MPNIASMLKHEITRIARKTTRTEIEGLKKTGAQYRADIIALKRRIVILEQQVAKSNGDGAHRKEAAAPQNDTVRTRFSAKGLHAHRQRLELSAADCGLLLGVSAQTIYNWEAGSTRPRNNQLPALSALRGLGKAEAKAVVADRKR